MKRRSNKNGPDQARLDWHEVKKVEHYYLSVDAMTPPMSVREDPAEYERQREMDRH